MRHFTSVYDFPDLDKAVQTAFEVKKNPYGFKHLGKIKRWFLSSSIRACVPV
jgi:hypothetical protein